MAQFRAYRLQGGDMVLDLQSDLMDGPLRVVAPLRPPSDRRPPLGHLEPVLDVAGAGLVLHVGELAGIPGRFVAGQPVADLRGSDYAIRRALDLLFSGF